MTLADPAAALDPQAARRLSDYVAAGYDPLTTPIDWYVQDRVPGAPRALGPAPAVAEGLSADAVDKAVEWAAAQGSTALIVSLRGRIVVERYWHGDGRDTRFNSQSMAKTVAALLVGSAIDRGEIASVDDAAAKYLPEWRGDDRSRITIRHLLQMASGLAQIDGGRGYALVPDNPAVAQYFGDDYLTPALGLLPVKPPETVFDYNNNDVTLVAAILERVSRKRYAQLLSERLWQPLGLASAAVGVDRAGGHAAGSTNIFARPVDWARIGELIARRGNIDGRQIVSAAWIDAMQVPSSANKGYGYWLWRGDQAVGGAALTPVLTPWQSAPFAAQDIVFLNGFGGQRVWIMPGKQLVVVRAGRTWPKAWDDAMLPNLLWNGVAP